MASSAQALAFIEEIGYIIQEEAKARGYKLCSPIIAQACLESNYGVSTLAANWHNYFGMKCGKYWTGKSVNLKTKEEYNSQLVTIYDNFRVFDDMESGVIGYFDFINTKRYSNLKEATTPQQYLEYIKADGYATSSAYVTSNLNLISRYDLQKYDWENNVDINSNPYPVPERVLKRGKSGDDVKWLQWELNNKGYAVGNIDGTYGPITESCVTEYQMNAFVDGIAGPKTITALQSK